MFTFLRNPAFWSSIAAVLAALGVEVPQALLTHILELLAILSGIVGIVRAMLDAGYRVKVEAPPPVGGTPT